MIRRSTNRAIAGGGLRRVGPALAAMLLSGWIAAGRADEEPPPTFARPPTELIVANTGGI